MKKFIDHIVTALAISLGIPTLLILISWNAVPGSGLYPIKAVLEDMALALTVNTALASKLSLEFTDRRNNEATTLLVNEGSTVGYELLVAEAKQTQNLVYTKHDVQTATKLVDKIEQYQSEIEYTKTQVVNTPSQVKPTFIPTPTPIVTPKSQVITTPTQPTQLPEPKIVINEKEVTVSKPVTITIKEESTAEVLQQLENTNVELEKIKQEVQIQVPTVEKHGRDNDKKRGNEEKEQKKLKEKLEKRYEKDSEKNGREND